MPDASLSPPRPDILLTIFHIIEEAGLPLPMTEKEVMSLIAECRPTENGDRLFKTWCEQGLLRKRRGRYYVLCETARSLEKTGLQPALDLFSRNVWISDNMTVSSW